MSRLGMDYIEGITELELRGVVSMDADGHLTVGGQRLDEAVRIVEPANGGIEMVGVRIRIEAVTL